MCDIQQVASKADVIVNGYAFTKSDEIIKVLNLGCCAFHLWGSTGNQHGRYRTGHCTGLSEAQSAFYGGTG